MSTTSNGTPCIKCTQADGIAMCFGCQQSFCSRHFIKHRLFLSEQIEKLFEQFNLFKQDLKQDNFENNILTNISVWEEKSIAKVQEIARTAREDFQKSIEKTKSNVNNSLNQTLEQLRASERKDNFTEIDLEKWNQQLNDLRNLLEKPTNLSLVQDKKCSSPIHRIKLIEQSLSPESPCEELTESFVVMYGPCQLSDDNRVVTHSDYRAGLSQITGHQNYSSGKHSIRFLIEKKGTKNIFFGIHSITKQSSTFDNSIHGWWNFDYMLVNGESQGGDNNEIIQTGDRLTLTIDCDQSQIQLKHHQTKRRVCLPIQLQICPFPWKILVRLLATDDCLRIL